MNVNKYRKVTLFNPLPNIRNFAIQRLHKDEGISKFYVYSQMSSVWILISILCIIFWIQASKQLFWVSEQPFSNKKFKKLKIFVEISVEEHLSYGKMLDLELRNTSVERN